MRRTLPAALLALSVCLMGEGASGEPGLRLKARMARARSPETLSGPVNRRSAGRRHWILEFSSPPGAVERQALRDVGVAVSGAVGTSALTVSAPDGTDFPALGATASVLGTADKISPALAFENGAAVIVEFHADVAREDARAIVAQAGLAILEHPDLLPNELLVAAGGDQAAALSDWDEVAYIFPAALELIAGERMAACPGAMLDQDLMAQYVAASQGWGAGALHYFIESVTARLDRSTVESEIMRAFAEWSRYAPVDFVPASGPGAPRTVDILFGRGAHGDAYPFDGPGKVLAHTYYPAPPNREPLAGDMHLDDDEPWSAGGTIDLFTIALHEAGHALGLAHSDRPGSVMYPYYRKAAGLTADDIAGVRQLYGSRDEPPAPPADPPAASPLSITIVQPAGGAVTATASGIAISGRAAGGTGALEVKWRSDRGGEGAASGGALWTIALVPLASGSNRITVTATDQAGASASASVSITRQDQSAGPGGKPAQPANQPAPALAITSPAFTIVSTSLASMTLRGTASAGAVSVLWSNSAGGSGTAVGTASWTVAVPLAVGSNAITVRAYSAAGASSWRSVTVVRK